ncbi:MAG: helix-turn-helix transcriptional regulator [Polyangiaceae bacterium]|jgi:DNA-binding PadR family transcriptional regulator
MDSRLVKQLLGEYGDPPVPSLSAKEATILNLLSGARELYGLQIVAESNGEVGRGTVYVTLARMEEKGFVESWREEQAPGATGLPRRLYRVTSTGANVLQAYERAALVLAGARVLT